MGAGRPRPNVTPRGLPMRTIGRSSTEYVVASAPLGDILDAEIQKLDTEDFATNGAPTEGGGVGALAERTALYLPSSSAEAIRRRLWAIRNGESRTVGTEMADAMLLAVGRNIEDEETIATLPGGKPAAMEMAQIAFENAGETFTLRDVKRLADQLFDFSRGYTAGCEGLPDDADEWNRHVDNYKNRIPSTAVEEAA